MPGPGPELETVVVPPLSTVNVPKLWISPEPDTTRVVPDGISRVSPKLIMYSVVNVQDPELQVPPKVPVQVVMLRVVVAAYASGAPPSTETAARPRRDKVKALPMEIGPLHDLYKFYTASM
jgi:hypothetical protein